MRRSTIGHEITVGWFIVLALVLLAGGLVIKTRSRGLIGTTNLTFELAQGLGLQAGSPVQIQGIPVGEVSYVELTPENRVLVTLTVANRYVKHIYTDAIVNVIEAPLGFSATKVVIDPGVSKLPADPEQNLTVFVGETLMDQVAVIQSEVRTVIGRLDRFVSLAESSLLDVETILGRIERKEGLAGQLIGDEALANDVTQAVESLSASAARLETEVLDGAVAAVSDARALIGDLRAEEGDLRKLLRDGDSLVLSAQGALTAAKVGETSASLRGAAEALNATAARMDVSEETREALEAMRRASESFEALSRELERQPDSVIFGKPAAASPGVRR